MRSKLWAYLSALMLCLWFALASSAQTIALPGDSHVTRTWQEALAFARVVVFVVVVLVLSGVYMQTVVERAMKEMGEKGLQAVQRPARKGLLWIGSSVFAILFTLLVTALATRKSIQTYVLSDLHAVSVVAVQGSLVPLLLFPFILWAWYCNEFRLSVVSLLPQHQQDPQQQQQQETVSEQSAAVLPMFQCGVMIVSLILTLVFLSGTFVLIGLAIVVLQIVCVFVRYDRYAGLFFTRGGTLLFVVLLVEACVVHYVFTLFHSLDGTAAIPLWWCFVLFTLAHGFYVARVSTFYPRLRYPVYLAAAVMLVLVTFTLRLLFRSGSTSYTAAHIDIPTYIAAALLLSAASCIAWFAVPALYAVQRHLTNYVNVSVCAYCAALTPALTLLLHLLRAYFVIPLLSLALHALLQAGLAVFVYGSISVMMKRYKLSVVFDARSSSPQV